MLSAPRVWLSNHWSMAYLRSIRSSCVLRFVGCFSVPVLTKPAVTKEADKVSQYQKNIKCRQFQCVEEVAHGDHAPLSPPLEGATWFQELVWLLSESHAGLLHVAFSCPHCASYVWQCFALWCFNTPLVWFIQLMLETKKQLISQDSGERHQDKTVLLLLHPK